MIALHNVTDLLSSLIQIESVSGDSEIQRRVQDHVTEFLQDRGIFSTRLGGESYPWTLISTDDSPQVLFACHVDVVPVGNPQLWSQNPFSGSVENGRIHGRGSVDMKGGIAAAAAALLYASEHGQSAGLLLTSDEEIGILGAIDAAPQLPDMAPKLIIIPEPTENEYSLGHRGVNWFKFEANGQAAHASTPERGENAIELLASRIISRLPGFPTRTNDYLGSDTLNLGTISGGSAPNMVPESAELVLDVRTVEDNQPLKRWLSQLCGEDGKVHMRTLVDVPPLLPASIPPILKDQVDAGPQTFATDGAVLSQRFPGSPVVIWGPGERAQMHAVNESLDLNMLQVAINNYVRTLRELG